MAGFDIPNDVLPTIVRGLHPRSAERFKGVAREWANVIYTSNKVIISTNTTPLQLYSIKFQFIDGMFTSGKASKLNFTCVKIWGSCHGVLLVEDKSCLSLINPNLKVSNRINKFPILVPLDPPDRKKSGVFGFGFDSSLKDYYVVAISWYVDLPVNDFMISVFRVSEGIWRTTGKSPYYHDISVAPGVLVKDRMHWLVNDDHGSLIIVGYNLSEERFEELMPPSYGILDEEYAPVLGVRHGCLTLVFSRFGESIHVWIMKKYGVGESWTKLPFILTTFSRIIPIVPVILEDNYLVVEEGGKFVVLVSNSEGVLRRDLEVSGLPEHFSTEITVADNLFSLASKIGKVSVAVNRGLEVVVRGHKFGLLSADDYNNLCRCETVADIKVYLSSTAYGPYFQSELVPLSTTIIMEKCALKLFDDFKYLLGQAAEPLSTFLEYIRYGYIIDNIVLIVVGTLNGRDFQEILRMCHPLGMFDSIGDLAVAQNMQELYSLVVDNTPVGPYFSEGITSEDFSAMNTEIMRSTLYKAYLEDFYRLSKTLGGATAEVMSDLLAFESDWRAVDITINSIGSALTEDDRRKLYPSFGLLHPYGHLELARCVDFDQVRSVMENHPAYLAKLSEVKIEMLDKAFIGEEVKRLGLSFEQQFHYAVFFAYVRLREQEVKNLMWICQCVAYNSKSRVHDYVFNI